LPSNSGVGWHGALTTMPEEAVRTLSGDTLWLIFAATTRLKCETTRSYKRGLSLQSKCPKK